MRGRAPRPRGTRRRLVAALGLVSAAALGGAACGSLPRAPQPLGDPAGWRLVFSDEFNAANLDTSRWTTQFPWGSESSTTPLAVYRPGNVTVSNGNAVLTAQRDSTSPPRYTTGMLSTGGREGGRPTFELTHGYVEVRAQLPQGAGLWPAIWLLPVTGAWPPEIDIMEWTGSRPNVAEMTYHYADKSGEHQSDGEAFLGPSFSDRYHTFAVEWTSSTIRWFIDGVQRRTAFTDARAITNQPMYLLVTLQVGGGTSDTWPGTPNQATPFPARFAIDYVRIWTPR